MLRQCAVRWLCLQCVKFERCTYSTSSRCAEHESFRLCSRGLRCTTACSTAGVKARIQLHCSICMSTALRSTFISCPGDI
jgi:hypothetical protein